MDSLVGLAIAVGAVVWARAGQIPHDGVAQFLLIRITLLNASFSIVFAVLWKQCLTAFGLYRRDLDGMRSLVMRTAAASATMTGLLGIYLQARHARGPHREILLAFFATVFLYETLRVLLGSGERSWQIGEPERVIILGSGRRASKAWRQLRIQHYRTRQLVGFVDDRSPALMAPDIASRHIGMLDTLPGFLLNNAVDELIVAVPLRSCYELAQRAVLIAEAAGIRVVCLNDLFALNPDQVVERQQTIFLELLPKNRKRQMEEAAKRLLDVLGSACAMLVLSPLFLAISLAIKITTPGSLFLVEERHGYARRRFRMLSFRNPIAITPLGKFLHRTLLDRLPALWNVLTGDMSFVGPRPMSAQEIARFGKAHLMRRFSVRPGMTGNWQMTESSKHSLEESVALDFSYIDHWSLALDFKILASTVPAMLKRL